MRNLPTITNLSVRSGVQIVFLAFVVPQRVKDSSTNFLLSLTCDRNLGVWCVMGSTSSSVGVPNLWPNMKMDIDYLFLQWCFFSTLLCVNKTQRGTMELKKKAPISSGFNSWRLVKWLSGIPILAP